MFLTIKNSMKNQLILFVGCLLNVTQIGFIEKDIIFLLLVSSSCLLMTYRNNKWIKLILFSATILLASFFLKFVLFFPVLLYVMIDDEKPYTYFLFSILGSGLIFLGDIKNWRISISYFFLIVITLYLKKQAEKNRCLVEEFHRLDLASKEQQFLLNQQNLTLINEQNLTLDLGIAEERNRIARDIHDNVGHLLSSSLIQIGALQVINHDENLEKPLELLNATVKEGMDTIRESVHNLHDDSLNLKQSLVQIVDNFQECPIELTYTITSPLSSTLKIDFLMIIRESLANVMKHSQSSNVILEIIEQPGFYRVRIKDNGVSAEFHKNPVEIGMGLASMKERITKQSGRLTAERLIDGFQVLAIVPREKKGENKCV